MRSPIRTIALTALLALTTGVFAFASGAEKAPEMGQFCKPGSCESCHVDKIPTRTQHDLLPCPVYHPPSWKGAKAPAGGPGDVVISTLADQYNAVKFPHGPHAGMSKMNADSCWTCHHNTPVGKPFPACDKCHQKKLIRENLSTPNLKAAYHQQCLNCHKEWSHTTKCENCHAAKGAKAVENPYPTPKMPAKFVYNSTYQNSKVTFFHDEHVKQFNLGCVDCHKDTKCAACHDTAKPAKKKPVVVANHDSCLTCHKNDSCELCHRKGEATGTFNHASTGFPLTGYHAGRKCGDCHKGKTMKLNPDCKSCHNFAKMKNFDHSVTGFPIKAYHKKLPCTICHPASKGFTKLDPTCSNCHKRPFRKNFDHKITGVKLGEIHSTANCVDCHPKGDVSKGTDCNSAGCHDRKMSYPKYKPTD